MTQSTGGRKAGRPRINISIAIPLGEAETLEQAVEVAGVSRNEFIRSAAVDRARQVLHAAGVELEPTAA